MGKIDIYSLYKREKEISHKDDKGQELKILLTKMTQGERRKALDVYEEVFDGECKRLQEKEDSFATFSRTVKSYSKEDAINGILTFEEVERSRIVDLFPVDEEKPAGKEGKEDKAKKEKEETAKRKKEEKLLESWRVERRKEHKKSEIEPLKKILQDFLIQYQARVKAQRTYNLIALSFMCRDTETKERIFESKDKVEEVLDVRIITWLLDELNAFETVNNQQDVRKAADSTDFTETGTSPEAGETDTQPSAD